METHNDITEHTQEGASILGYSISHDIPSSILLRNRRGYQGDTAPEPVDGIRTMTTMTDLLNNVVDRSRIVILLHTLDRGIIRDSKLIS